MGEWKKTNCTVCGMTCGLEAQVENNRIVRVRGDKDNPKTHGYCCRKGRGIQYLQHQKDRNLYPMKRVGKDQYERISWEQAISEICERLKPILEEHGPRAFACQGLGGFYGALHTVMAKQLMARIGSQLHFRALAAELTGVFWSVGVLTGNQSWWLQPDEDDGDVLLVSGWNPYVTHQMLKAKDVVKEYSTNPDKCLIVIDPRRSETARMADIHLAIRPGTDALLWRAMVALVLQKGWYNQEYIDKYVSDLEQVKPWFEGIDVKEYCKFCELDYEDVEKATYIMATRNSGLHSDLGVICGRHSTVTTHLQHIFLALCGKMLTRGGQVFSSTVLAYPHTDIRDPKYWRTTVTDFPQIGGMYPTASLAEEIDNDHPQRIRALFVENSNPIHSVVDTSSTIKALEKLELLVVMDCALTETARMADYILPNSTGFECYEMSGFTITYPSCFAQLRHPILEREGEILDGVDIWLKLYEGMGYLPEIPESLYKAAEGDRGGFLKALGAYLEEHPEDMPAKAVIMVKTLGRAMGSTAKACVWVALQMASKPLREACARKGFPEGPMQMEAVFQAILEHPEGIVIGEMDSDHLLDLLETEDKKLHLYAEELNEWIYELTPEQEAKALRNEQYPFILSAGNHIEAVINHTMRGPEWIKGKENPFVVSIHPADAERLGIADGQLAKVTTDRGEIELPARISRETRRGSVLIPHGFGMLYDGERMGTNVNVLTNSQNRDRFAGTPFIRYVPCRVEVV